MMWRRLGMAGAVAGTLVAVLAACGSAAPVATPSAAPAVTPTAPPTRYPSGFAAWSPYPTAVAACAANAVLTPGGAWRAAAEIDRAGASAVALVSGPDIAVCRANPMKDGSGFEPFGSDLGAYPAVSPQVLTYTTAIGAEDGSGPPSILAGRVPPTAAAVRLAFGDGTQQAATLGGGLWLAWLTTPAVPTRIEALDASGTVVSRLADASGVQPAG